MDKMRKSGGIAAIRETAEYLQSARLFFRENVSGFRANVRPVRKVRPVRQSRNPDRSSPQPDRPISFLCRKKSLFTESRLAKTAECGILLTEKNR